MSEENMDSNSKFIFKKILVFLGILLICTFLGWCGGNILGDYLRKTTVGFDVGSRIGYWIKGVSVGAPIGLLLAVLVVRKMEFTGNQTSFKK